MGLFDIFQHLYIFFSKRQFALFVVTSVIILSSFLYLGKIELSEDIKSLLPDSRSDFLSEFNLLQQTPFMHKVIINLKDRTANKQEDLTDVADKLAEGMSSSAYITHVTTGPDINMDLDIYSFILKAMPNLTTSDDIEKIGNLLTEKYIKEQLADRYASLFLPEGSFLADDIRLDPLDLKSFILKKLVSLNMIPKANLENNHFVDSTGTNVILIADTNVNVTDTLNSEKMLAELIDLRDKIVPKNIDMSVLSPQSYTVANARTIKKDLVVVLSISSLSLIFLFFLFLKNWRACFVLLISFSSFAIALVGVSLFYKTVSAITIGFGSVLLGLSDDLSLHVYFALRREDRGRDPSLIIAEVSRPVLFGGAIIIGSLSLLLFSDLPGQRQLGLFSVVGVLVSLAFTLILLPQMMRVSSSNKSKTKGTFLIKGNVTHLLLIICIWIFALLVCAWYGRNISFNGDLNQLNFRSQELKDIEANIRDTWGDFRSKAMIISESNDLESTLETNDRLFRYLMENNNNNDIISIAPILPSIKTQKLNYKAWKAFWSKNKDKISKIIEREGASLGFTSDSFVPFFKSLEEPFNAISLEQIKKMGMAELFNSLIIFQNGKIGIITLAPDNEKIKSLMLGADCPRGVRFISQKYFGEMIRKAVGYDFIRFIIGAVSVIALLLIPLFRNLKKVLLSMVPVVTGMIFMFGTMGLLNISFNIFNIISTILIIGLGIDYGIFMVCKCSEDYEHDTDTAVLLSGLTTITGFGALVFAQHPALYSIGLTVLLGIGAAIPSAIYVIPALYNFLSKGKQNNVRCSTS